MKFSLTKTNNCFPSQYKIVLNMEQNVKCMQLTLVGRFLPIYFPEYHFVEEGCYVLAGENIDVLGEVSPDGSIRRLNSDNDDTPIL